ncbi:glycerophosphodiester phosphodiesterase [Ruania alba]|uniref:Glycerophosphoryl diester phosphodiesterase n=1 Tax=Ruania alba TaxID=648782 RepID=A0A1H5DTV2_9MICO|nr:glycerophosphodiester phosphodiesterase family protein [Ruania alba]SED82258.1 glycerophosphoryl diester phosphodiesterase [Ruania alba]
MQIYAHRGASAEQPENTLAAFDRAIELGVDGIELDVHLSADGVPVVIHDDTLDRTTSGTGAVNAHTEAELARTDAGSGEHVPTLAEVLDLVGADAQVNVEIKDPAAVDAVARVTAQHPQVRWFASGGHWEALAHLTELVPGLVAYPLSLGHAGNEAVLLEQVRSARPEAETAVRAMLDRIGPLEEAIAFATQHGAGGVSVWERHLTADDIDAIQASGLAAWVWTVNSRERTRELRDRGIDALCTDDPAMALDVVAGR